MQNPFHIQRLCSTGPVAQSDPQNMDPEKVEHRRTSSVKLLPERGKPGGPGFNSRRARHVSNISDEPPWMLVVMRHESFKGDG